MDRLMQANLQIIELLGAVFEEVERQDRAVSGRPGRPQRPRAWIGRPQQQHDMRTSPLAAAMD